MSPEPPSGAANAKATPRSGFDLLEHLALFLGSLPPQTLLITGASGSGKSTLLRTLVPRLKGPPVFIAYRTESSQGGPGRPPEGPPVISLLFIRPGDVPDEPSAQSSEPSEMSIPLPPATWRPGDTLPQPIFDVVSRLAARGEGFVMVDSWDAASEREFRTQGGDGAFVQVLTTCGSFLQEQFGRLPLPTIVALPAEPDPEMLSAADGLIQLGWEEVEGFRLRVISIPKLRRNPVPESRYLYSLDGSRFYCPPQFAPGFRPPIGAPPPDPTPGEEGLFPGSLAFTAAFGRLRVNGLTALEVPPRFTSNIGDVFLYPLVAHTLAIGGRVLWIPSPTSGPVQITKQLSRFLPPEFFTERLRILSAGGTERSLGDLSAVVLPVRRASGDGGELRSAIAPGVGPLFPDAHRFLSSTPEGKPSLYVIYLDGLNALSAAAGVPINVQTFALVVGAYVRLPRFHGFGFGRVDDPLTKALRAVVDTQLHLEEKYGRTVLLGIRPRTNPYILDWPDESGRYSLVPMK